MATITGTSIVSRAAIVLQDTTGVRWPQTPELLLWLNDGQREIVLRKPDANAQNVVTKLTTGTKQTLPDGTTVNNPAGTANPAGIQLLDVIRNMGTGSTPSRAVTRIDREILDEQMPTWHSSADGTATVQHYMFDQRDPKHFYVYPYYSSGTQQYIEIVYAASPSDLATLGAVISLDDVYSGVLLDYILYRAYSKDADLSPTAPQRAISHYNAFLASLGAKGQIEQIVNPNSYDFKEAMEAKQVGRGQ